MTAAVLLDELRQKGVEVWAEGEQLRLRAPRGVLTPAMREALQDRKRELLGLLGAASSVPADEPPAPLSFTQERVWFVDRLGGGSAYNVGLALRVAAPARPELLERALGELVRRHAALRTTCALVAGRPMQRVAAPESVSLERVDLAALGSGAEARARELTRALFARPFDLQSGPLLRAALYLYADGSGLLALATHHFVADGWSMQILARELQALEAAFAAGQPAPLAPLALRFADWARLERAQSDDARAQRALAYWRARLTPLPPALELPCDHAHPAQPSGRGARVDVALPAATSDALRGLARQARATPFAALAAACGALLARVCAQSDVALGTAVSQRERADVEGLVGPLSNNVVLRLDLRGAPTFRELLARARETCVAAWEHQHLPFERLVQELHPERDTRRNPLFQVLLLLQQATAPRVEGARLRQLDVDAGVAVLDLGLALVDRPDGLRGALEYSLDLFEPATAQRLAERFTRLVRALVEQPDTPFTQLDLLHEGERRLLLLERNATDVERPALGLHELFALQAQRVPTACAVRCGPARLTHAQLDARANRLARLLRRQGVTRGSVVGLCLGPSVDLVTALVAVLKAGGACLPLDPTHPRERLRGLLRDAEARLLLSERRLADVLPEPGLPRLLLDEPSDLLEHGDATPPPCATGPDDAVYVVYTSGSTGTPKGALLLQRGVVNQVAWRNQTAGLGPGDVVLQASSLAFDISLWDFFGPLAAGACVALPQGDGPPDAARLWRLLREHGVTVLQLAVSRLRALLEEPREADAPRLRVVFAGGESLEGRLASRALRELSEHLHHLYGPSEATVDVTQRACLLSDTGARLPIGRPIANQRVYLLDEQGEPVPPGSPGELCVGGDGVARGYVGRPDLSAAAFVPDPFGTRPGARLYRTGDLARWRADGELEFVGRRDQQVKVRGVRIELQEIEATLRGHPAVRAACADVRAGADGVERVLAWIVPQGLLPVAELRAFLRERLPAALVPAAFVTLDALPLTPTGKLDRRALPEAPLAAVRAAYVAPRDAHERALAELWAEVLGRDEVGIEDDFFECGGHSLLAARLQARVEERLGVELPLRLLFERPTIAALAPSLRASSALPESTLLGQAPALRRRASGQAAPLSFAQQRLWFLEQLEARAGAHRIPLLLRLHGALDEQALAGAVAALVQRHEVLRSVFVAGEGEPLQLAQEPPAEPLTRSDLSGSPDVEGAWRRLAAATLREPMDLSRGPLFRALLARLAAHEHGLLLDCHHAVSDGWSLGVMLRELQALYRDLHAGQAPSLPELPVQYGDFALWQRAWLNEEALGPSLRYWRERLEGLPVLALHADHARPARPSLRAHRAPVGLAVEVAEALRALARAEGATTFMVLLAGYLTLLHRHGAQSDLAVGTPVASRPRRALEDLVGLFVNTLVLRGDLGGRPSFRTLLRRVRAACLADFAHQEAPFERLVHELHVARSLGHAPLVQALLVHQDLDVAVPQFEGLSVRAEEPESATVTFDLVLSLTPGSAGLRGSLDASADLFEAGSVERLARRFETLMAEAVRAPDTTLVDLPLLCARERAQVLREWNAADDAFGLERPASSHTMHALVAAQARRTPDAVAVIDASQGVAVSVSFAELQRRASALAGRLRALGVGPGARVGVCLERSLDWLVALLGALEAGGAYLPLDPAQPAARLRAIVADARPVVLLCHARSASLAGELRGGDAGAGVTLFDLATFDFTLAPDVDAASRSVAPDDVAYVLYTSGSTGLPKGVMVPHGALCETILWRRAAFELDARDRILQNIPIGFDPSLWQVFGALISGARLVLAHHRGHQDFPHLVGLIAAHGVTVTDFAPAMLRQFLSSDGLDGCRSLRHVFVGGEALPLDLLREFRARFPGCALHHIYGPTETAIDAACWTCGPQDVERHGPLPIGRPLANRPVYLLDERLAPVGIGQPGELCVGGHGLARGYLGCADASAERFIPDPFASRPGARLYRTGDLARLRADGALEFLGRRDHQVKVRGQRVELGEIERRLEAHAQVGECVLLARGSGDDRRLLAYVTPRAGAEPPQPASLRASLRRELPDYMVPAALVVLDVLPRLASGKVDRERLPEPAPEAAATAAPVAPRNELEQRIATIWSAVLGRDSVGVEDNFFDLGGHSLLLVRVHRELLRVAPRDVSMLELFEHPTVAALARHLGAAPASSPPAAEQARETGRRQAAALRRAQDAQRRARMGS